MTDWKINKKATHKAVVLDIEKRILSYNDKLFWVRIAGKNGVEIYVYDRR